MRNELFDKLLNSIPQEEKDRTNFFMTCLDEWNTYKEDIINIAEEEGLKIDNDQNKYALIEIGKQLYIKGVLDAYSKLK